MSDPRLEQLSKQYGLTPEQLAQFVRRGREDPVFWCQQVWDTTLYSKSRDILYAHRDHRHVAVPSCNGGAKSWTAAAAVLHGINHFEPYLALTTAPTERQVRAVLWKEIRSLHARARFPLAGTPDLTQLIVGPDQRALGFATTDNNSNHFQGMRSGGLTDIVFDEAAGMAPDVYEGAFGIMGAGRARFLELGNPTDPQSKFAEHCASPHVSVVHISAWDTPNFNIPGHVLRELNFVVSESSPDHWTNVLGPQYYDRNTQECRNLPTPYLTRPEFVQQIVREYGVTSPQYVARVEGRFPEQSEEALFGQSEIEEAMQADMTDFAANSPIELGVDVARWGSSSTVVVGWQEPVLRVLGAWSKTDTVVTTRKVLEIAERCARHGSAPLVIRVDDPGIGGSVVDQLSHTRVRWGRGEQSVPVIAFNPSLKEGIPEKYENARAMAYCELKERVETRKVDLPAKGTPWADALKKDLLSIRKHHPDGQEKTVIRSKHFMREHRLPSPDYSDAAVIAQFGGPRSHGDHGITV